MYTIQLGTMFHIPVLLNCIFLRTMCCYFTFTIKLTERYTLKKAITYLIQVSYTNQVALCLSHLIRSRGHQAVIC